MRPLDLALSMRTPSPASRLLQGPCQAFVFGPWHKRCIAPCTSPRWREWDAPSINGDRLATTGPGKHDCVGPTGRQHEQAKAPGTFWFRALFFAFEKPDWL